MKRRSKHQGRRYLGSCGADQVADTLALCAIPDLVVILDIREEPVTGQPARRPAMRPLAMRGMSAVINERLP